MKKALSLRNDATHKNVLIGPQEVREMAAACRPFWNACILAATFDDLPPANCIIALSSAGDSARKPHPVAGFGCKVFKYLLGAHETLQDRPGSNLLTTRRFTRMAGRNSRYHHTLKRGLEQCSPTLKSATFSLSISSLRN
jgi:hypothetical protein